MSTTDRTKAQELVLKIARSRGYLREEILRRMEPDVREEVEESSRTLKELAGLSVITLAKELYSSKARFVFELLQNADDNSYAKAIVADQEPYVTFRVFPHRIIIECNEDGFNSSNLRAICSVGQSSKLGAQGYIGEKGIGFKSCFMAAWKVHIQSGAFSFSFSHRREDSGLGMITPVWEATDEQPESPLTRITLYLHEDGNPETLARRRAAIQEQFEQLNQTILLFMKNLRRIHVRFYSEEGHQKSSTSYTILRSRNSHTAVLKSVQNIDGMTQETLQHFHVTDHSVTNLPRNEARNYSKAEEGTQAYSSSQITLAFPLSETSVPIIEPQDLFAFLPVRRVGFNFLIQADFATNANRQDIVEDSLRNWGLLDGIADAFIRAVRQFCTHSTLRYHWMRFLPDKNNEHLGVLWKSLVVKIAERLSSARVLYGHKSSVQHTITYLLRPLPSILDEDGEPLLDDDPERIVSSRYSQKDLDTLTDYGLSHVGQVLIHEWLKNDLQRGQSSRMKHPNTPDAWHTRVATMLHLPFEEEWGSLTAELRAMDLLPLEDGTWVSILSGAVYFSQSHGMDIPYDIGLRLVSHKANNAARRKLFKHLGVREASASFVRKILQRYELKIGSIEELSLENSRRHLEFLFNTQESEPDEQYSYQNLEVCDQQGTYWQPLENYMYIISDDPHGASELFRPTKPGPNPGDGAPGYDSAIFIDETYFQDGPSTPKDGGYTWLDWFQHELTATKYVATLDDLEYVQEHRPEKFMDCLRIAHQRAEPFMESASDWIRQSEVLCRGNHQIPLADTYFPVKRLERLVDRFTDPGAFFPWIWLDTDIEHDEIPPEWKALMNQLNVGSPTTDLDLALAILRHTLDAETACDMTVTAREKLFDLYEHIQIKHWESTNRVESLEKIRELFSDESGIYIPLEDGCTWAQPEECVWIGPENMMTKFPIKRMYQQFRSSNEQGQSRIHLTNFFVKTLGISNCTWENCVEELKALKDECDNIDTITDIYKALDDLRPKIVTKDMVRDAFEKDALIYLPTDDRPAWHRASQCVWSNAAKLKGRVSLNVEYERFKELFVDFLGVRPIDLSMAIDELQETGNRRLATADELKESIWTVNSLLLREEGHREPGNLPEAKIFPIKYPNGAIERVSISTDFFLVDREPFRRHFEASLKFFDFTLEEVSRLYPFIEWTGLEERYLSRHVKEFTSFHGTGASLISNPDRQICNRAHALVRISRHFDGPQTKTNANMESFYSLLRNGRLYESDEITSSLYVIQDGTQHSTVSKTLAFHLDESDLGLKIYLPRDKADQEYAFGKPLPERLFAWMMQDPLPQGPISKDGINAIKDVLLAPRSRIFMSLDDNGIAAIDLECLEDDASDESESSSISSQEDNPSVASPATTEANVARYEIWHGSDNSEASVVPSPGTADEQQSRTPAHSHHDEIDSDTDVIVTAQLPMNNSNQSMYGATASVQSIPLPLPLRPSNISAIQGNAIAPQKATSNEEYVALLDKVIQAARFATIPDVRGCGTTQPQAFSGWNSGDVSAAVGGTKSFERNHKVGAAGELFVFEMLSRLMSGSRHQAGLSRDDWKSNMRKHVTGHPKYQDMEPWSGKETSDITHIDDEGVLTNIFVEKGYLERSVWADERPEYFIEVKTTNMDCEAPFFMSKAQYHRMKRNVITKGIVRGAIYVIFRVYNLGRDDMGIRVYLDPESLRLSRQLSFTPDTWSVVPGHTAS